MSYGESISGAVLAVRDLLRVNIDAQLVIRQAEIDAQPLAYTIPSSIPSSNIRIRMVIASDLPQLLPAIHVIYIDRSVIDTASIGIGQSNLDFWIYFWVTAPAPDLANDLDVEEVIFLTYGDIEQSIIRALRRNDSPSSGIYGKADNSIQGLDITSDVVRTTHVDSQTRAYTLQGRMRFRMKHRPDY